MKEPRHLPQAAAAAASILVGSGIVATRGIIDQAAPVSLAFMRYIIALSLLFPVLLFSGRPMIPRPDLGAIALLGIVQFGLVVVLLNYGLQFIPSARVALIFATMPMLTMILAVALRREQMSWAKTLGVLFTIIGVALALGEQMFRLSNGVELIGDAFVLASALGGAVCSVLYEPYLRKYRMLHVSVFSMVSSVLFLGVLALGEGIFRSLPGFTMSGWLAIFFIGASSAIGTYLWLWALGNTTPTKVTVFLALSPVTAASFGTAFLSESVSFLLVLGIGFVALGLWLVQRS